MEVSAEEIQAAQERENAEFQAAKIEHLNRRVILLNAGLHKAEKMIEELLEKYEPETLEKVREAQASAAAGEEGGEDSVVTPIKKPADRKPKKKTSKK